MRAWWPLQWDSSKEDGFQKTVERLMSSVVEPDIEGCEEVSDLICRSIKVAIPTVLEKDTLPNLCHAFVGWGNATFDGEALARRLGRYVHSEASGAEFVHQAHGEGDFHPWQTFCYMSMAGISPATEITSRSNLKQLAEGSTEIHTQAMEDLGHLLLAYAQLGISSDAEFEFIDPKKVSPPIKLDIYGIIREAIRAHQEGGFRVCRKFHLTEGLCAIVNSDPALESLRPRVQSFFDGQMDVVVVLERVLHLSINDTNISEDERAEREDLRKTLFIGKLFENHLYDAGHLVELAAFGELFGFKLRDYQRRAIDSCIRSCNFLIKRYARSISRTEAFLPFSHYRRGITLWSMLRRKGVVPELSRYAANFDIIEGLPDAKRESDNTVFNFARDGEVPRGLFSEVLKEYELNRGGRLAAVGGFKHFRRVNMPGWHRQLHYELLDYGDRVGAELHFENPALLALMDCTRDPIVGLAKEFPLGSFVERIYGSREAGKLAIVFADGDANPENVAHAFRALIDSTASILERELQG